MPVTKVETSSLKCTISLRVPLARPLLFRRYITSDSLQPHGLKHARLPCPSPSSRICPSLLKHVPAALQCLSSLSKRKSKKGLPRGSVAKNLPASAGAVGLIPGSGRPPSREKGMATHSSILACRIPWTLEPGRL